MLQEVSSVKKEEKILETNSSQSKSLSVILSIQSTEKLGILTNMIGRIYRRLGL